MADINYANLKIFARLVKSGFVSEKQIVDMGIGELIRIPKITPTEIKRINEFQNAIKAGNVLSFLVEENKSSENLETLEESEKYEA